MLLDSGADVRSGILVVPHHGGRNPLVPELAKRTGARYAVISGGYEQAEIAAELKGPGFQVFTTRDCGAITFRHDGKRLAVETFLER
jgi:competence protein ComEC